MIHKLLCIEMQDCTYDVGWHFLPLVECGKRNLALSSPYRRPALRRMKSLRLYEGIELL